MNAPGAQFSSDWAPGAALVTGATGFLGGRVLARLRAAGRAVTIVSRSPRPELEAAGVRVVAGALHDPAVCAEAVRGAGTVFHVAARVGVWGAYADFHRDNVLATRTLLAAARAAGVARFVHTSTPSVVYNGRDLAGADESLPLTTKCPSPYPLTKALAEAEARAAHTEKFRVCALRPHLIWGVGDPHLVPRILARAAAGRLRVVGGGQNRVDMVHVENAADAQLLAERALAEGRAGGKAYFITNGEPVNLWQWVDGLLRALGRPPLPKRRVPLALARALGAGCEAAWALLGRADEPPMTRFIAAELAKDHWFDLGAARRDLGYAPRVSMAEGTAGLVAHLRSEK
ncbi:MAG: NAD-dependent epimerase/dehydratase family protein [Verrucomicrobia bacterium]|nr:NAD-dependent epimerase/dehydratase family protein [Verrucomicrobiota bacterium]